MYVSKTLDEVYHYGSIDKDRISAVRKFIPLRELFVGDYDLL